MVIPADPGSAPDFQYMQVSGQALVFDVPL